MEYALALKRFEEVADGTRMFLFGKPEGFIFQAGQYVALQLAPERLVEPDIRGGVRSFSIASAPHEDELHFVMRAGITGFKKTMWDLHPGDMIGCTKAVGHCTVPADDDGKVIVLLSGGVGIAPARAMLRDASFRKDRRPYVLFYSNRFLRDAAFHNELLSVDIPNFRYVFTLSDETEPATEPDEGRGYITADMIRKYLPDTSDCHYYVIGAPGFADAMKAMLLATGVPESEIKIDPFTGLTGPVTTGNK